MMEEVVNQLAGKLEARVARVTEKALAKIMETVDNDHKKLFVSGAYRRVTREIIANMLNDGGVREAFESAVI